MLPGGLKGHIPLHFPACMAEAFPFWKGVWGSARVLQTSASVRKRSQAFASVRKRPHGFLSVRKPSHAFASVRETSANSGGRPRVNPPEP